MSPLPPRAPSEAEIMHIGESLLDRTLPQKQWTHAAHCIACLYLMLCRPDIDVAKSLPGIIWRYNAAVGTPNSDQDGYHETITRFYIQAIAGYLARQPSGRPLTEIVAAFLASPFAARDFALRYWSKDRLMSVEARRVWVEPDLRPLDLDTLPL
ncbi:MAG TPA: hypothetical protein PLR41_00325 [Alphaproteobacteria bacterium]|nr:hypothetical protein [Alphaproteobacteria bacterium]